jgi:uncharacterized protein (TIGR03000 family)
MYSIVLAAALTTGTAAPAHGGFFGCHGCHGGCSGWSCCGGCYGSACYGGGSGWGHGCYSSCYGCCGGWSCCGGCYSSCYGGGWGCWGSCYGSWSGYNAGCWGSGYGGAWAPGWGCSGNPYSGYVPAAPYMAPVGGADQPAPATVIIKLPADARLTVNGQETKVSNGEQRFRTPALEPGRTYSYEMTVTGKKADKEMTVTRKVTVRAGQESLADFTDLAAAAAEKSGEGVLAGGR